MIAIDGTKVHANASAARNLRLRADRARDPRGGRRGRRDEDERYGERRGDELPEQLATGAGPREVAARGQASPRAAARRGGPADPAPRARSGCGRPSAAWRRSSGPSVAPTRPMRPTARAGVMRNGRRLGAHSPPKPYTPPATPQGKINTTDPDSRNVKTLRGWVQGYNAQAVDQRAPDRDRRRGDQLVGGLRAARADARRRPPRAARGRRRRAARGRARGRRLLAPGPDASARRRRHRGADPARRQQAKGRAAGLGRRPLRVHAPRAGHARRRASSTANAPR